jgi:3-hydroxyisobutyrate dehydrogenase
MEHRMAERKPRIGWIGTGRMGFEMAQRLAKAGCDIHVWNRTRAKAEPLAKDGAKIVSTLPELAGCDIVFVMVSTWNDVKEVVSGPAGMLSKSQPGKGPAPRIVVECSSISLEGSAELRKMLAPFGTQYLASPVSGNAKVIKAGKLTFVCSGSWVGDGELARIVKICHNVMLGVVTQCMAEITVLAEKAGVPRHAFLEFLNKSVMGSTFTRYKAPAFVNLDFHVTFTPYLLRKDLDLGLEAGRKFEVPMPLASITRDLVQSMMGAGMTEEDFSKLLVQQARASGLELKPENVKVGDGLSS